MPRKIFDVEYGDHASGDTNDDEFLERLSDLARRYGYFVQRIEVEEADDLRDETRWIDN